MRADRDSDRDREEERTRRGMVTAGALPFPLSLSEIAVVEDWG